MHLSDLSLLDTEIELKQESCSIGESENLLRPSQSTASSFRQVLCAARLIHWILKLLLCADG
jgi:hypothetical protein